MPRVLPVLTVAALAVALAGCTAAEEPLTSAPGGDTGTGVADITACVGPGAASDTVTITGDFGAEPVGDFATPVDVKGTQRSVVIEGDGAEVAYGDTVLVEFALWNGTSGDPITTSGYDDENPAAFMVHENSLMSGLLKTINCATAGSRVVGVVPAADAFGDAGEAQLGVNPGDPLVFVVDVIEVLPREWTEDVPAVSFDGDVPTVTLPDTEAPASLKLTVLEEGDGEVVPGGADGADVEVFYQGTSWDTGEIFDQNFGGDAAAFNTRQVVQGFSAALVGQKVGSTVLVSMPPELAYGLASDANTHPLAGQTLVFLIEIVSVG